MNAAQLINQTSGDTEYYTDPKIIEAARSMMGGIDCDPASSKNANEVVRATIYYDITDGSLNRPWLGRVWMNHPFHGGWSACTNDCKRKTCATRGHHIFSNIPSNADWINKLMLEWEGGNIIEALCITYASTSEQWFQPLLDFPQCFLSPRTNYYLPDGTIKKGVTKGSVITYLGDRETRFHRYFKSFGKCHKPL